MNAQRTSNAGTPALAAASLPFTVRLAATEEDLYKAVRVRHATYARLTPELADRLKYPEAADTENGVVVLLAQSKEDGAALGSMRIQSNQFRPLHLEQSVALPGWLQALRLVEASRFGVTDLAVGPLVETMMFKACYLYCKMVKVDWIVIAGRIPIDAHYEQLLFEEIFPDLGYIPLQHAGNLPHRIMSLNIATAQDRWQAAKHPLFDLHFRTLHPDIDLTGPAHADGAPIKRTAFPPHGPTPSQF